MPQKTGLGLLLAQAAGLCLLLDVPLDFTQLRPEASAPHVLHPRSLLDGGSLSSLGVRLSSFSLFFPLGSRAPAVLPAPASTPLQQRALGFSLALP